MEIPAAAMTANNHHGKLPAGGSSPPGVSGVSPLGAVILLLSVPSAPPDVMPPPSGALEPVLFGAPVVFPPVLFVSVLFVSGALPPVPLVPVPPPVLAPVPLPDPPVPVFPVPLPLPVPGGGVPPPVPPLPPPPVDICPLIAICNSSNTPEPSLAVALTVTVPLPVAVSRPPVLIVALPVLFATDHVTDWSLASAGSTAAVICKAPPFVAIVVAPPVPITVIEVTGTSCPLMVTVVSPYTPVPSFAVALTVTVPLPVAVSRPPALIVALPVPGVTDHVIVSLVASAGLTTANICKEPPSVVIVVKPPAPVTMIDDTGTICPLM